MRVNAGLARGRSLKVPAGRDVRPLLGRAKDVLFDTLGERIVSARFLDLFAGSGSVGIEALSRGAARALFVEASRRCVCGIRENLQRSGMDERAAVVLADALRWLKRAEAGGERFDLVFCDPPYRSDLLPEVLPLVRSVLSRDGTVMVKHHFKTSCPATGFNIWKIKRAGDTQLTFLVKEEKP